MTTKLRYAAHAFSWTSRWSNESVHLIDHAKSLGLDLIEIPFMEIQLVDPEVIRAQLEETGFEMCASTVLSSDTDITSDSAQVRKAGLEYLKLCIDKLKAIGGNVLSGVIYSEIGRKLDTVPSEKHWKYATVYLKEAAKYAADFGIKLGIEPVNRYETFLVNTASQALYLKELIDEPNIFVHLDAYHMNIEENDFYMTTKSVGKHLCHYHLSESHRGVPGAGLVDWEGIYRALAEIGYTGIVGLESFVEPADCMRAATCVWRKLAPSSDYLISEGLKYLKSIEAKYYGD